MSITFNEAIENLKPSESIKYIEKAKLMKMDGIDVIGLGGGDPDFPTPKKICDAAYEGMTVKGNTHYTLGKGIPQLRQKVAEKLQKENHISCGPDNILITPGGKMAIYNAVRALLNAGDQVLCPEPCWVSYAPIVQASGGVPVSIGLSFDDDYHLSASLLEAATTEKTKMVIINYPCNPTGRILHEDEAAELVKYLTAHPDVVLLSDEVYEKIIFDGNRHISPASYPEIAERVITVNGFSKCAAMTGWRLGYAAAPSEILEQMVKIHQFAIMCAPTTSQYAAVSALRNGDEDVVHMRESYDQRRRYLMHAFKEMGLECFEPHGAFYTFPSIKRFGMTSDEFATRLLQEEKVAVVPGTAFGDCGEGYLRISYAYSLKNLKEALGRIERFIRRLDEKA